MELTAEDKGTSHFDNYYGHGRVNAYYALLAVVGPPNFRITNTSGYVNLAWDAIPINNDDNVNVQYEISRNINGWGWNVLTTTTSTSFTDNDFEITSHHFAEDDVQYKIRSNIDNVYSLYSNIISTEGISYYQQQEKTAVSSLPKEFLLLQNSPNPFNPATTITYEIPEESFVSMEIFNSIGQRVGMLVNEIKSSGRYSVTWNAGTMPSGLYFLRMHAGNYTSTKKMLLMR